MDTPEQTAHRLHHRAAGDDVTYREPEEVEDGEDMMEVRMPIASTGEVRNTDDDPLTREELAGMARQLREREIGVFPSHGDSNIVDGGRYSQFEKLGVWADGDVQEREVNDVLMATARMPDPETLPNLGQYREALGILKEQAKRGIPMDASIGWREDDDFPGGNDLMEASIVGIGADWRTNTGDESAEVVAREAVAAGADPDELVERVARAVRTDPEDERPFGPPGGDADKWEDFEDCVQDVEDWDNIDDPEAFCAWAEEKSTTADAEQDTDMPDDDTGDDPGTTDDAQDADADEAEAEQTEEEQADERADECPECGHGVREDANFCSECGEDLREDDEDEEEEEGDDEEEDEEEQSTDAEQSSDLSELEERLSAMEDTLDKIRAGEVDVDTSTPDPDEQQDVTDTDDEQDDADAAPAGPNWRGD